MSINKNQRRKLKALAHHIKAFINIGKQGLSNGVIHSINEKIEIGKSKIIQEGKKLAILSFGARLNETLKAAENLKKKELI